MMISYQITDRFIFYIYTTLYIIATYNYRIFFIQHRIRLIYIRFVRVLKTGELPCLHKATSAIGSHIILHHGDGENSRNTVMHIANTNPTIYKLLHIQTPNIRFFLLSFCYNFNTGFYGFNESKQKDWQFSLGNSIADIALKITWCNKINMIILNQCKCTCNSKVLTKISAWILNSSSLQFEPQCNT